MITTAQITNRLVMLGYPTEDKDTQSIEWSRQLIVNYVVNFCHFTSESSIPYVLEPRIVDRICAEFLFLMKNSGQLKNFNYDAVIKNIKEGDTQIQFASETESENPESRFDKFVNYMEKGFDKWLAPHRRLRW